jgi:hypothetical protein
MEAGCRSIVRSVQAMDLLKAIRQLYDERARLDRVIGALEELQKNAGTARADAATLIGHRGRKGMGEQERLAVSERMKKYWASRRRKTPSPDAKKK